MLSGPLWKVPFLCHVLRLVNTPPVSYLAPQWLPQKGFFLAGGEKSWAEPPARQHWGQRNALGRAPAGGGGRREGKGPRGRGWRRKKTCPLSITSWELVRCANPLPAPDPLKLRLGVGTPCAFTSPPGAADEPLGYRPGPLCCSLVFDERATERIDQPVTHSLSCTLAPSESFKNPSTQAVPQANYIDSQRGTWALTF